MSIGKVRQALQGTTDVFSNGRGLLLVVMLTALAGITVMGVLHDIDAQSIVALYSAIIGGAIGHANGNLQGRLAAERENLLAQVAAHDRQTGS